MNLRATAMINRILRGFLFEKQLLSLERRQYQSPPVFDS